MKMFVVHERIPEVPFLKFPTKGRPTSGLLYTYSKNYGFKEFGLDVKPHTRGGATTVSLVDEDLHGIISGRTVCSMSDNFSYKEGRDRALLRATNLGLGHDNLDSGRMFYLHDFDKLNQEMIKKFLETCVDVCKFSGDYNPNTLYFHPETAEIIPKIDGFRIKTSKIILKSHVWIGFEEE